jgi:hypothetical protein
VASPTERPLIVVLHWGELAQTAACVASLAQQTAAADLLLIDNGGDPDATAALRALAPGARVLRSDTNLGVAGGRNLGLEAALAESRRWVFLFDNDAVAAPDLLERLLAAGEGHPNAALLGPKILDIDQPQRLVRAGGGSWRRNYLSSLGELSRKLGRHLPAEVAMLLDNARGEGQPDDGRFDDAPEAGFITGGAQLIRVDALRQVGLLDAEFSPYGGEDIEFCARLEQAGWQLRYVPEARCFHPGPGSYRDPYRRAFYNTRNMLLLARKRLGAAEFYGRYLPDLIAVTLPLKLAHAGLAGSREQLRGITDALAWTVRDAAARGLRIAPSRRED